MENVQVIIEKSGTGYAAYIPVLPGCIATGESVYDLKEDITKALQFHLEGLQKDKAGIPKVFSSDYVLQYSFDVETFLAYYKNIFTRRALSRITGINESLLSQYASGLKHPRKEQSKKIERGLHRLANELLQVSL